MILALSGKAGSGKDTVASLLDSDEWVRVAFADGVREAALAIDPLVSVHTDYPDRGRLSDVVHEVGWDEAKKRTEVRRILQMIGTEAGRDIHGTDCWVNLAVRKIRTALGMGKKVVVTDLRFPNEAQALLDLGAILIRLHRKTEGFTSGSTASHPSETALDDYDKFTLHLYNEGSIETLRGFLYPYLKDGNGFPKGQVFINNNEWLHVPGKELV